MLVVVVYDIINDKRLSKISKLCSKYGQRVQNSVFECQIDYSQFLQFKAKLKKIINKNEDSIIFYNLGNTFQNNVEVLGKSKITYKQENILIV